MHDKARSTRLPNLSLLPNLLTVGNGICGFVALVYLSRVQLNEAGDAFVNPELFSVAAWLVLLGMLFDVFDGKVARMSGSSSELGAQLDSLCDLVTFGLVPAFLIVRLNIVEPAGWQKVVLFFSLAYFLGALLRLARFNVENSPEEEAHQCFKGMPSPAAAGCVATLVIFHRYLFKFEATELELLSRILRGHDLWHETVARAIPRLLPFLGLLLGFTMVSNRLQFDHVGTTLFHRGQSFDFFAYLVFGIVIVAMVPEVILPIAFIGYLVWTPLRELVRFFLPGKRGSSRASSDDGSPPPSGHRGSVGANGHADEPGSRVADRLRGKSGGAD